MKTVGIITFHWPTNYGAILQTLALQQAISRMGFNVEIINYKPRRYDDNLWTFFRYRKFLNIVKYRQERRKENFFNVFRKENLNLSKRFFSTKQLQKETEKYDILISGSDQVMNPWYLAKGERGGSKAYFLDFGRPEVQRLAYAVSFGVTKYPENLIPAVKELVSRFNFVSARENTGVDILKEMGAIKPIVVPDPTILHSAEFYNELVDCCLAEVPNIHRAYFLRGEETHVLPILKQIDAELIMDKSIEQWINAIRNSKHIITNSFHGVVFSIIYNIPFSVVLTIKQNVGMNDRFYTLLKPLGLEDRIFSYKDFTINSIHFEHNWDEINSKTEEFRKIGFNFLKNIVK